MYTLLFLIRPKNKRNNVKLHLNLIIPVAMKRKIFCNTHGRKNVLRVPVVCLTCVRFSEMVYSIFYFFFFCAFLRGKMYVCLYVGVVLYTQKIFAGERPCENQTENDANRKIITTWIDFRKQNIQRNSMTYLQLS